MLRATLLKLGPDEHMLLVTTHHIAADGWSIEVLWKEMASSMARFSVELRRRCRSCRSSTRIFPCGNRTGCRRNP